MAKISQLKIRDFKRFTDLTIEKLSNTVKLVVLVGPNGSGKSSLFEALNYWQSAMRSGQFLEDYHAKIGAIIPAKNHQEQFNKLQVSFHDKVVNPQQQTDELLKKCMSGRRIETNLNSLCNNCQQFKVHLTNV